MNFFGRRRNHFRIRQDSRKQKAESRKPANREPPPQTRRKLPAAAVQPGTTGTTAPPGTQPKGPKILVVWACPATNSRCLSRCLYRSRLMVFTLSRLVSKSQQNQPTQCSVRGTVILTQALHHQPRRDIVASESCVPMFHLSLLCTPYISKAVFVRTPQICVACILSPPTIGVVMITTRQVPDTDFPALNEDTEG
jgi:hypothetical protein